MRKLPLSPREAFVFSRVDGSLTESELALLTGLDPSDLGAALNRLQSLGALAFGEPVPEPTPSGARVSRPSGTLRIGPIVEMHAAEATHHPGASPALYDPSELDEPVELEIARKRQILDTYYRLETLTHYELLQVPRDADKKAVKASYYELVNVFHPDRYYGKHLGGFKSKLERSFARITEAHDVLTRAQARQEYDRYLAAQEQTRALDRTLSDVQASAREAQRIEREIIEQARAVERAQAQYPQPHVAAPAAPAVSSVPPASASTPPQALDPDARRRALARKLGVSVPPPSRGGAARPAGTSGEHPIGTASMAPPSAKDAATDDLKRRYEKRVVDLTRRQIDHYVRAAEASVAANDLVSAANALRIAVSLAPKDEELAAKLADLQLRASATLAASYLEQAQYEEREGRFAEAARSFERVARGKASPKVFERVAFCLLSGRGDLRAAAEWAKRAVAGAPEEPAFRVTLARVYLEAGLRQSAIAEFERAATLSPKDDTIKDWLRRAKRGDA